MLTHGRTATVGGSPPTVKVGDKLAYDMSSSMGQAADALLSSWRKSTTTTMRAPWRMTAGSGGSEFGSLQWYDTLKSGFGVTDEVPQFKLWQLALADHLVRPMPRNVAARR